uniref:Uncharacterized protein n=1 Tax=Rhizophora mucronata TaxID=61149 RepID=A0A2P2JTZ7_RHIMU
MVLAGQCVMKHVLRKL